MKNLITSLLLMLLSLSAIPASAYVRAGGGTSGVGGGGTSIAAQFVYVGRYALNFLVNDGILTTEVADAVLKKTSVIDGGPLCTQDPNDGSIYCLDARYSAISNRIEFDRARWAQKSCEEKFMLASHEYLRATGLEDSNYIYSNAFLGGGPIGKYSMEMSAICRNLPTSSKEPLKVAPPERKSCRLYWTDSKTDGRYDLTKEIISKAFGNKGYEIVKADSISDIPLKNGSAIVLTIFSDIHVSFGARSTIKMKKLTHTEDGRIGSNQLIDLQIVKSDSLFRSGRLKVVQAATESIPTCKELEH